MIGPLLSLLSPGGPRARLSILIFHRVMPERDPLMPGEIVREDFDRAIGWMKRWFHVLPLGEAVRRLQDGSLPPRAACVTFDDGYADNHDVALPVLQRHGVPASFFVATAFRDGGLMWNDALIETIRRCGDTLDLEDFGLGRHALGDDEARRRAVSELLPRVKYLDPARRAELVASFERRYADVLPRDLMMTSDKIRALHAAGMTVGAHTVHHPILALTPEAVTEREIRDSKAQLEALLDHPVRLFAYPNGVPDRDYRKLHARQIAAAGFDAAVSTAWGAADGASDVYQLPRFTPWERTPMRFGLRLAQNLLRPRHPQATG